MAGAATYERIQPQEQDNVPRSFDPLASINILHFDLLFNDGRVLPETRERVRDEQLSYLAEGMDRAARTTFVLRREGDDLVYFHEGKWTPYMSMLFTGLEVAKREALGDPRRQFLADWAVDDLDRGFKLCGLRPGQQMVWHRSYPRREGASYDKKFMQGCGLFPDREMGFLYRATCQEDGLVVLESQTMDRSDEDAFAAAEQAAKVHQAADLDVAVDAYDEVLAEKRGNRFHAGRLDAERDENVWDFIREQHDLITYLLDGLESIAAAETFGEELELVTKKHIYGVWALFKKRLDGEAQLRVMPVPGDFVNLAAHNTWMAQQVQQAFHEFTAQGRVLVGCGGAISMLRGEADIMNASPEDVFSAIFGDKAEKGVMRCVNCPKCRTFHDKLRASEGKFTCRNKKCGYQVKA